VVEITLEGDVLREWSVTGEDTWSRFSREIDYRQVATTKPHRAHPNFAFLLGEDIWTTRCDYKDAVCLTRPDHRIDISVGYPHDGHVFGDWVYFTTVDAHIVIANSYSRKVEQIFDLNTIDNPQGHVLGWCRGVLPVTETLIWVGFTRLRHTKFVEKLSWLKKSPFDSRPSRIALYDLSAGSCLQEIDLSAHGMDMVFSVVAFPSFDEANLHLTRTDISSCVE